MALMLSCRQIYRAVVPLWYRRVCTSRRLTFHRMRISILQGLFCNSDALRTVKHLDLDWIICTSGSSAMRQSFCAVSRLNDVLPAMQTLHTLVLPERLVHCGATLRLDSLPSSVRRLAFTRPRDAYNWFVETLLARDVQDPTGTGPDVAQQDTFESRHSILCHASVRRTLRFHTGVTHLAFGCADCECRTMDRLCALGCHGLDIQFLRLTGEMLFSSSLYAATRDFTFRCLHTIDVIAVSESSTLSSTRAIISVSTPAFARLFPVLRKLAIRAAAGSEPRLPDIFEIEHARGVLTKLPMLEAFLIEPWAIVYRRDEGRGPSWARVPSLTSADRATWYR
ncbi:hypothetical protein EXIGLDRAFT_160142 [Exidia glandulosa HHB12029]|uniref:Uncharacterized protein n=1 Tax=Exidia glandulosa HHB12029 TaxID=1314781 RepID=A0A165FJ41_EXIGL|nr:hypothetical protein EXIGLDRAFT_160142 [Exidia glandulosa HHB12029]